MPVSSTWTNPSAAGTLDLATGAILTETWVDAVASNFLFLGGTTGKVTGAGYNASSAAASTTSASFVVIANPLVTITTSGLGVTIVTFGISVTHSITGTACNFCIFMDGANVSGGVARATSPTLNYAFNVGGAFQSTPTAASHSYQIGWSTVTGTLTLDTNVQAWINVLEVRR